jgi:hypothetical protein
MRTTLAATGAGPAPLDTSEGAGCSRLGPRGSQRRCAPHALFEDFFVARKPLKGSPHTEAAYRGDLAAISAQLAADLGTEPETCAWAR